jgi:hypothetical protein
VALVRRLRLDDRLDALALSGALLAAVLMGLMVARSPTLVAAATAALVVAVTGVRFGALGLAVPPLLILPWMVVLEGVAPALLGTLCAAAGTGALLLAVLPLRYEGMLVPVAAFAFVLVILGHAIFAVDSEQYTQAAKFLVFPGIVLAVTSARARELMPKLRVPLLASCIAAMTVHLLVIAAGLGNSSDYYGAGERLGFAADGPHALALLATVVAAAGLTVRNTWMQIAFFTLGAVPAMLTGVRSALLGIVLILAIFLWQSRSRLQAAVVLGAIGALAVATGAVDVVLARFAEESGEYGSFAEVGSGRGLIWTVAINGWEAAGAGAWLVGAGLRSVADFEVAELGKGFVGHSDLIEVLVQLGLVGFGGWLALWVGLLRHGLAAIVLLPVLVFGVVNGTLEYVAALTFGICVAAACANSEWRRPRARDSAG